MRLQKIAYADLNSRQRENYNFQKVSALFADYGFTTMRLSDDWQGADFIAQHIDGDTFLKVQLKGRLTLDKKYLGKRLFICFPYEGRWYLYPHDELLEHLLATSNIGNTESWSVHGLYSMKIISQPVLRHLADYLL